MCNDAKIKKVVGTYLAKHDFATYFDLLCSHLCNQRAIRNRNHTQLAFLMVATRNRNCNFNI